MSKHSPESERSEVEIMNRLGFNFDVVPSLVQIGRPLIYQESEVHEGTCELKRRSWGYGGADHGSEIWSKSQRYKEGVR